MEGEAGPELTSCSHCGRATKTVDGLCVECWGVKDAAMVPTGIWVQHRDPFPSPGDLAYAITKYAVIALVVAFVGLLVFGWVGGGPHAHVCGRGVCW